MAAIADKILTHPADYAHLGAGAIDRIRSQYSSAICLPKLARLYGQGIAV
jgi:hypothetical protein